MIPTHTLGQCPRHTDPGSLGELGEEPSCGPRSTCEAHAPVLQGILVSWVRVGAGKLHLKPRCKCFQVILIINQVVSVKSGAGLSPSIHHWALSLTVTLIHGTRSQTRPRTTALVEGPAPRKSLDLPSAQPGPQPSEEQTPQICSDVFFFCQEIVPI